MGKKKAVEPQIIEEEGKQEDAFNELLGTPVDTLEEKAPETPPPEAQLDGSLDEYLKNQVYQEMYGTDQPSTYDRIQSVLRKRL